MVNSNKFLQMLKMLGSIESYSLKTYLETLFLAENLQDFEEKSPNKPPFAINFLEYYDSREPVTSWIIRHIFAYTYKGRHPFFESFVKQFLQNIGFNVNWIKTPTINKDHEYKGIDILIRDKKYAIVIENKLKGAEFQLNQLARYIAIMRLEGYSDNQIFVVILPRKDISNNFLWNSVWNLPKDWQSISQARKCRIDSYTCWCDYENFRPKQHCNKCESLRNKFEKRTLFIHKGLSDWLFDCIVNNTLGIPDEELRKQYVLISAILQFVDFLNFLYQTRENNKFKMDIQKFLSEQLHLNDVNIIEQLSLVENKKNDVEELVVQLDSLYWKKIEELILEIRKKYKVHIVTNEKDTFHFSAEIIIDRKTIILSLGYEYGSDFCQLEMKSQKRLPKFIMDDFEICEELNDKDNRSDCIWKYDSYKESLLRFDRLLGRLLDIKNNMLE